MKLIGKPSVNINQIVPGNVVYHLKNTSIGFANMKGDFWVRVYLVHLVLLVAVPVRSVTVCRVRTEPSSTCDAACVRAVAVRAAAARTKCGSVAQCASACSAKGARKSAPFNVRYFCVVGPLACAHYGCKCQILSRRKDFFFLSKVKISCRACVRNLHLRVQSVL